MTEEFQTTGTWWSSSTNMFSGCSIPRSTEIGLDVASFEWQNNFDVLHVKTDMNLDSTSQVSVVSPSDWNQPTFDSEGGTEAKFDPNGFFEGLLEPCEQLSSSWPRTDPILDSRVTNAKPELLHSLAFFENVLSNDSGAVSVFHGIRTKSEEEHQASKNLTSKRTEEKTEDLEGYNDESPRPKRPRIETPSPLPSFKVRKEKLRDRITALQQLVSPFGKTDTASVLHEAVEYIKFLHEQVTVLSNPYVNSGAPVQLQQSSDKSADQECQRQDLLSRGLCLMPISSTVPVAAQMNTSDFWNLPFRVTLK